MEQRIVAVGLLTQRNLDVLRAYAARESSTTREDAKPRRLVLRFLRSPVAILGDGLKQCWPVEEAPNFSELLRAIDEADLRLQSKSTSRGRNEPN